MVFIGYFLVMIIMASVTFTLGQVMSYFAFRNYYYKEVLQMVAMNIGIGAATFILSGGLYLYFYL